MSTRTLFATLVLLSAACELPSKNLGEPIDGTEGSGGTSGPETSGQTSDPVDSTGEGSTTTPQTSGGSTGQTSDTSGGDVMCGGDPQAFPEFSKQCATVDDCALVIHQTDCCGNMAALGLDKAEVPAFDAAEAICASQYPGCDCAPSGIVAEDGAIVQSPVALDLACTDGLCKVFVDDPCEGIDLPACPPACDPNEFPALCGQPCADEGAACGNNIGDGMVCSGGQWGCAVHPPLGLGCNLVCK